MEPVWQSLLVLSKEWPSILGMLGNFFLGGAALSFGLKAIFKDSLIFGEYFTLGAGGALLSLLLGALLVRLLNLISGVQIGFIWGWIFIFLIAILLAFRTTGWRIHWTVPNLASTSLALLFICSAFIRLAFIWDLQVPLYFDSAMHYSIITDLMKTLQGLGMPDFQSFVGGYYHLGFHILAAAFSLVLKLPAPNVMLLFGQIVLALLPLPLFFIIRQETKLDAPGIFAVLLASVGWYMPAHMLDWGKYPALTSLLSFEFSLCCLLLLREAPRRLRWALVGLVAVSILFSTFIHSRSLVLPQFDLAYSSTS